MKTLRGFTLVEVLVGLLLTLTLFQAVAMALSGTKAMTVQSRHSMQAMEVVRATIENLKGSDFDAIASSTTTAAYDAGADHTWNTTDDLTGTLTVTQADVADFDADGNIVETWIDINGDTVNDSGYAKPVRVQFAWTQATGERNRLMSVYADTLIAS